MLFANLHKAFSASVTFLAILTVFAGLTPRVAAATTEKIRVLVIMTPAATTTIETDEYHEKSNNSVEEHVGTQIDTANQVLVNSGLGDDYEFEVAGIVELDDYDENATSAGEWGDTQSDNNLAHIGYDIFTADTDVRIDGMTPHEARVEYEADIAIVIAATDSACCGHAQYGGNETIGNAGVWVLVESDTAYDHTTAHEIGHLTGLGHPNEAEDWPISPEARGYLKDDQYGRVGTIMMPAVMCDEVYPNPCSVVYKVSDKDSGDFIDEDMHNRGVLGDTNHDAIGVFEQGLEEMVNYAEGLDSEVPVEIKAPEPIPTAMPDGCINHQPYAEYSWYSKSPDVLDQIYKVEKQNSITGLWSEVYEDDNPSCIPVPAGIFGVWYRIRSEIDVTEPSEWQLILVTGGPCGGGE